MPQQISPPSVFNQLLEGRFAFEISMLMARLPLLIMGVPRGHGRVIVLPGFMADDDSTFVLRGFLRRIGYTVEGWNLGRNKGPMMGYLPQLLDRVIQLSSEATGEPLYLVGWSRGGMMAREVARERPDLVKAIVTMGSPVKGSLQATSIRHWIERTIGATPQQLRTILKERQRRPITVPITAIYSKTDGVVSWEACIDDLNPQVEHRQVNASHVGMGFHPDVYRIVAQALAASDR